MKPDEEQLALHAMYLADLKEPCLVCHAQIAQPCRDENGDALVNARGAAIVHFTRRLRRLVAEKRPDLLPKQS